MKTPITVVLLLISISLIAQSSKKPDDIYVCVPCNNNCDTLEFDRPGTCTHCDMQLITKKERNEKYKNVGKKKIAFYLQPGVEVLDFAGPMEVFAYADFEIFTVSKTKEPITSQGILTIVPDYSIHNAPQADILAFFGGNASNAFNDKQVIDWVKNQQNIAYHFSVCTGVFALAKSGILDGMTATTFHNALSGLEKNYPKITVVKDARFVDNGKVVTTAGISAGIDGALHLVAKLQGFNQARRIAYHMEYDKWIPGEGLILTKDNPYHKYTTISNLKEYTGTYEYLEGAKVELKFNSREKSLYAILEKRSYPVFYLEKDKFTNLSKDEITFIKDKSNTIIGYTSSKHPGKVFKKLTD
ncbi:DJ-1/PfpI family protein [Aquimarina sp. 2201CG5-10]|uniref:DJ-1/PfpI family protein n=1 Tax=Aquimarina callyspongiae TaxID=3098150 RepID=UPI002AB36261|nr:DJ-1/PfpI family protein [Aquimarina sp. 2201CG5-10]MDY8137314.1 DJ-1/PfpI family protein [Aquimarina sp. 2201CG5-10]